VLGEWKDGGGISVKTVEDVIAGRTASPTTRPHYKCGLLQPYGRYVESGELQHPEPVLYVEVRTLTRTLTGGEL
jgi:hypothetical protein